MVKGFYMTLTNTLVLVIPPTVSLHPIAHIPSQFKPFLFYNSLSPLSPQ